LLLYVHDILIASNNKHEVEKVKVEMNNKFDIEDLGDARKILGIEIIRRCDLKCVYVSQETYLKKIINRFGITNLKPVSTPLVSHYKLSDEQSPKIVEEQNFIDGIPYVNIVDFVLYVAILQLTYVLSVVNRFMSNIGKAH